MPPQAQQRIAARAAIVKDKKVLVIRESSAYEEGTQIGRYDLPGGRIAIGESVIDALKREVTEEVGIEIEECKPFFVGEWSPTVKGTQLHIVGIFFVCMANDATVRLGNDHDMFEWVGRDDLTRVSLIPPVPEALQTLVDEGLL